MIIVQIDKMGYIPSSIPIGSSLGGVIFRIVVADAERFTVIIFRDDIIKDLYMLHIYILANNYIHNTEDCQI